MTATYVINRLPSRVIDNVTPLERLFKAKPNYPMLKIFGCACWPHLRPYNNCKLSFHSKECAFLGYSSSHKGYKCLDISSGRVYISRDAIFDEGSFPFSRHSEIFSTDNTCPLTTHTFLRVPTPSILPIPTPQPSNGSSISSSFDSLTLEVQPASSACPCNRRTSTTSSPTVAAWDEHTAAP